MANVDTHEEFWGITLSKENKVYTWNPTASSEEDVEHKLQITQACLGYLAVKGERNLIEVTTKNEDGKKIICPIVALTVGGKECIHLELGFNNPSKFTLKEGSGPIGLSGAHLQALPLDLEDDSCSESDSDDEDIPKLAPIITTKPIVVEELPMEVENVKVPVKKLDKKSKDTANKLEKTTTDEIPKANGEEVTVVVEGKVEEEKVVKPDGKTSKKRGASEEKKEIAPPKKKKDDPEKQTKAGKTEAAKNVAVKEESDSDDEDEDCEGEDDEDSEEDEMHELLDGEAKEDTADKDSDEGDEEPEHGDDLDSEDDDDDDDDDEDGSDMDDDDINSGDDDLSDEEDESDDDDDVEEEPKKQQNNKKAKTTLKENIKNNKQPPVVNNINQQNGKKDSNKENVLKTPKGKKDTPTSPKGKKDTPGSQYKKTPEELRAFLLKSPNLPKTYEKFVNLMKNNMKVTDGKSQQELWDFVKKNKK